MAKTKESRAEQIAWVNDSTDEELAKLAWPLAHAARIRILRMIIDSEHCLCGEIVQALPLAQSTVSQHLKILKQSGLIRAQDEGTKVCYFVNQDKLSRLKALIAKL